MVKVMAVNAGSSSLKFQLINMPSEEVITSGLVERIGQEVGNFVIKVNGEKIQTQTPIPDHQVAVDLLLNALVDHHIVESLEEIDAVGHRVVHGGEDFDDSVVVDEEAVKKVADLAELAPLHNPANIIGYKAFKEALPDHVGHVFVFDTAFHQTLDKERYLYPLPLEYYTDLKVRKYGAHGTSHKYVSQQAIEMLGNPKESRIIVCHLGNGASICAVENGKSVDTSMGLTPLEGLVMGTRSGDIDPAIMEFLAKKENLDIAGLMNVLNKKSGVYGLSNNLSSDFRDLSEAAADGNEIAELALDVFAYRVAKYVGSYTAAMNGVDNIVFTAGIGENSAIVRTMVCKYLGYLGIEIDEELNGKRGQEIIISTPESKVKVLVVPTNEELAIARETVALV